MFDPSDGDLLIKGAHHTGFTVHDAVTDARLAEGLSYAEALAFVRGRGRTSVWQINVDDRGRPIGQPRFLALDAVES